VLALLDLGRPRGVPLFLSPDGCRVNVRNWRRRVFVPAAVSAGLAGMHVHDLRHTAASLMIRSGATVKDVQAALGHKRAAETLDLYGHWWDDALDDVAVRMDEVLSKVSVSFGPTSGA
jgi:integrase